MLHKPASKKTWLYTLLDVVRFSDLNLLSPLITHDTDESVAGYHNHQLHNWASQEIWVEDKQLGVISAGDEIVYRDYTDISIAVATPKGLVVPVLRSCDALGFAEVEKARSLTEICKQVGLQHWINALIEQLCLNVCQSSLLNK